MSEILFPLDQNDLSFTASGGSTVRRSILPSGVRVLTEHMPGAQSVSVSFSVAVGSRDQTRGNEFAEKYGIPTVYKDYNDLVNDPNVDIIYVAKDGTVISIARNATPKSLVPLPSGGAALGVLEIPGGRAEELGLLPGDKIRHRIFGND